MEEKAPAAWALGSLVGRGSVGMAKMHSAHSLCLCSPLSHHGTARRSSKQHGEDMERKMKCFPNTRTVCNTVEVSKVQVSLPFISHP